MHRTYTDTTPPRNIRRYIDREQNTVEREARYHAVNGNFERISSCGISPFPSHLLVEGRVPTIAIVDTGACSILVGRNFAASIAHLEPRHLKKAPLIITACGQPSRPIGLSTISLDFILADGTKNRTKFLAKVIVMDTDAYDILLGMGFITSCGGGIDSQYDKFFWRIRMFPESQPMSDFMLGDEGLKLPLKFSSLVCKDLSSGSIAAQHSFHKRLSCIFG